MTIQRLTAVTLGVGDLARATRFYRTVFALDPYPGYQGIAFFELPGTWLILYPRGELARDIDPGLDPAPAGFSGVTLACNVRSKEEVLAVFALVEQAGGVVVKPPGDTFWGGFSGYFADPEGHHWEVTWGAMFDFAADGSLRFKPPG